MPTNREISFILRLKDYATQSWNKFSAQVRAGMGNIEAGFRKFGPLLVAAFSVRGIKEFVEASNVQEQAVAKLDAALRNVGDTSAATRRQMADYASQIQQTTTYGDEQIIGLQAQLVAMTRLKGDAIKPLVRATIDLAAGMNMDVEAAGLLIAKTITGQDALGRYGISVKGAKTETERMDAIIRAISSRFDGFAEAMAKTSAGQMKQFQNAVGDLKEKFGDLIKSAVLPLIPALKAAVEGLQKLPVPIQAAILAVGALTAAALTLNISLGGLPFIIGAIVTAVGVGVVAAMNSGADATNDAADKAERYAGELENVAGQQKRVAAMTKGELLKEMAQLALEITNAKDRLRLLREGGFDPASDAIQTFGDDLAGVQDRMRITKNRYDQLTTSLEDGSVSIKGVSEELKRKKDALDDAIVGSAEYLAIQRQVWETERQLAEAVSRATIAAYGGVKAFGQLSAQIAGDKKWKIGQFDTTALDKEVREFFQKAGVKYREGVNAANAAIKANPIVVPAFVETKSVDDFAKKMDAITEQLNRTDLGSIAFRRLRAELEQTQRALERALMDPFERAMADVIEYADTAAQVLGGFAGIQNQLHAAQMTRIDSERKARLDAIAAEEKALRRNYDAQKKRIRERSRLENLSTEERAALAAQEYQADEAYAVASAALEEKRVAAEQEAAAKEAEIKRQQFVTQKAASIIQATINTAEAVTRAYAQGGFFGGPAFAAIIGALGAAQIALIAAQPIPSFHEGTGDRTVAEKIRRAPASEEFPVLVRGGETIRTESQEAELQGRLRAAAGGRVSVGPSPATDAAAEGLAPASPAQFIVNINSPLTDDEWVVRALEKRLRATGLELSDVVVNRRRTLKVAG